MNIRRENVHINEHSGVCSAHFEGHKKKDKDVPTIFAWTKPVSHRAPSKVCCDPPTKKSHSVGITVNIKPEHHVSTTCEDFITVDKEEVAT